MLLKAGNCKRIVGKHKLAGGGGDGEGQVRNGQRAGKPPGSPRAGRSGKSRPAVENCKKCL